MQPTFVLVPGAFSNSFSYAPLQAELALHGHRSAAVDLPGHGFGADRPTAYQAPQDLDGWAAEPGRVRDVTLADNTAHLITVLERARRNGPVILVGHSRAGVILTAAGNARPDLVDRIVYIAAWCPVELPVGAYNAEPEMAGTDPAALAAALVGNPAELGLIRSNFRSADPAALAAFRAALLADGTERELLALLATFDTDENLDVGGEADRARADTWGRIPRTYIRLSRDASIPAAMQDRMIREADALTPGNRFDVHTLDSSHLLWLARPEPAARLLAGLAGPATP